jgi:hypothetical protein
VSLAMWFWRIYWDHDHGSVVRGAVRTILNRAPEIEGLGDVDGIDYAPGAFWQIRRVPGGWHEMEPDEIACCDRFLRQVH